MSKIKFFFKVKKTRFFILKKSNYYKTNFPDENFDFNWKTFGSGNNGWLRISSQEILGEIKFEENFHADDCDFWDSLDVYSV